MSGGFRLCSLSLPLREDGVWLCSLSLPLREGGVWLCSLSLPLREDGFRLLSISLPLREDDIKRCGDDENDSDFRLLSISLPLREDDNDARCCPRCGRERTTKQCLESAAVTRRGSITVRKNGVSYRLSATLAG